MTYNIPKLRFFIIIFSLIISFGIVKKASAVDSFNASSSNSSYSDDFYMSDTYSLNNGGSWAQRLNYVTNPTLNPYLNFSKLAFHSYNCDIAGTNASVGILKCYTSTWGETSDYVNNLYTELADFEMNVQSPPYSANVGDCIWIWASSTHPYCDTNHDGGCFNYIDLDDPIVINSYGYDGLSYSDYWFVASSSYIMMSGGPQFGLSATGNDESGLAGNNDNDYAMIYSQLSISTSSWQGFVPYKVWNETDPIYQGTSTIDTEGPWNWELIGEPDEDDYNDYWLSQGLCSNSNGDTDQICFNETTYCNAGTICEVPYRYHSDHYGKTLYIVTLEGCISELEDINFWPDCIIGTTTLGHSYSGYSGMINFDGTERTAGGIENFATIIRRGATDDFSPNLLGDYYIVNGRIEWQEWQFANCSTDYCNNSTVCDDIQSASGFWDTVGQNTECAWRKLICWTICPSASSTNAIYNSYSKTKNQFPFNLISSTTNIIQANYFEQDGQALPLLWWNKETGSTQNIGYMISEDNWTDSEFYSITQTFYGILQYVIYGLTVIYIFLTIAKAWSKENDS